MPPRCARREAVVVGDPAGRPGRSRPKRGDHTTTAHTRLSAAALRTIAVVRRC